MCHDHDTFNDTQLKCVMIHDTFVDTFLDTVQKRVLALAATRGERSEKTPHGVFSDFRHGLVKSQVAQLCRKSIDLPLLTYHGFF